MEEDSVSVDSEAVVCEGIVAEEYFVELCEANSPEDVCSPADVELSERNGISLHPLERSEAATRKSAIRGIKNFFIGAESSFLVLQEIAWTQSLRFALFIYKRSLSRRATSSGRTDCTAILPLS